MDKVRVLNDWMLILEDALSKEFCEALIAKAKPELKSSGILGEQIKNYRSSSDYILEKDSEEDLKLDSIIEALTSIPRINYENGTVINYCPGQEYKEHYDFLFHLDNETDISGDRVFTAIFYLNDNYSGGETYFPKLDISVKGKQGSMLIWKNYFDNLPNFNSLHSGKPVNQGEKWIVSKWLRENPYQG